MNNFKRLFFVLIIAGFFSGCDFIEAKEIMRGDEKKCQLISDNATILRVVQEIESVADFRIIMDGSVNKGKQIKTTIIKDTWEQVLRRLCTKNGYKLRRDPRRAVFSISK